MCRADRIWLPAIALRGMVKRRMTKAAPHHHYTLRDYLDVELASPNLKHEFVDGEIYAMAGGTVEHAALAGAIITAWTRRGSEWELAICEAGARPASPR